MDPSLVVVLVGLAINFIVMVVGGLGLLFSVWRYSMAMAARLAIMETNIEHLMTAGGLAVRKGDRHAIHS